MHFKITRTENPECFQHREMSIWGDGYVNWPDLAITHCVHESNFTVCLMGMYNYHVSTHKAPQDLHRTCTGQTLNSVTQNTCAEQPEWGGRIWFGSSWWPENVCAVWFFCFPCLFSFGPQPMGWCHPYSSEVFLPQLIPLRHTQRSASSGHFPSNRVDSQG